MEYAIFKDVSTGDYKFIVDGVEVDAADFHEAVTEPPEPEPSTPDHFRMVKEASFVGHSLAEVLDKASRFPGLASIRNEDVEATGLVVVFSDGLVRLFVTSPYPGEDLDVEYAYF